MYGYDKEDRGCVVGGCGASAPVSFRTLTEKRKRVKNVVFKPIRSISASAAEEKLANGDLYPEK